MTFYVLFLSIMIYFYSQVFRKERNFNQLTKVNTRSVALFLIYGLTATLLGHFLIRKQELGWPPEYLWFGTTYFFLMFITCLIWRRKDEKFLNPFILNDRWNIIGILGTLQYSAVASLFHMIPNK